MRAINSFWFAGIFRWVRSNPSLSKESGRPAKITATSLSFARVIASWSSVSSVVSSSIWNPCAYDTESPATSKALSIDVLLIWLEPPPWMRGTFANSPINAIFLSFCKGRISSFFNKTADCSAVVLASAWWAATSYPRSTLDGSGCTIEAGSISFLAVRYLSTIVRMRSTAVSNTDSSSSPLCTAFTISLSVSPWQSGISRSNPALRDGTRSSIAPQSVITRPSKPHSSRKTLFNSQSFSQE